MSIAEPLVSVVIPTYNRSTVITQTIKNVFAQTYTNLELIVVDDGSTDDTQQRLGEFGRRIRVIRQANAGPAVARNRGAELAKGEIIAFQDSDDSWHPTKLSRQVALLGRYGPAVPCCVCNAKMGIVGGREWTSFLESSLEIEKEEGLWTNVAEVLATRFLLFNQTVAVRRSVFERIGGFREDLRYLEDYDLPLRLALEGPWAFIRSPLVIYKEGAPESFSKAALKEPVVLRKCAVEIFSAILARVEREGERPGLAKLLRRRLRLLQILAAGTKLKQASWFGPQMMGNVLIAIDRLVRAGFRRSPWFPQPATVVARDLSDGPSVRWA